MFKKGNKAWNKGLKIGSFISEVGREKLSTLRKLPVKRVCQECQKEFWGGNSALYCSDACKPKVKRVYVYHYKGYKRSKKNDEGHKKFRQRLKMDVLNHYSGNPPKCQCCGENHLEFLVIDHIGGGGNEWRRKYHISGGAQLHAWLKKNNYPEGFRILCDNCNMSLGRYGCCPHQKQNTISSC